MQAVQTERTETVAFRVSLMEKFLLQAAAARRGNVMSDWLRTATNDAVKREIEELDRQMQGVYKLLAHLQKEKTKPKRKMGF